MVRSWRRSSSEFLARYLLKIYLRLITQAYHPTSPLLLLRLLRRTFLALHFLLLFHLIQPHHQINILLFISENPFVCLLLSGGMKDQPYYLHIGLALLVDAAHPAFEFDLSLFAWSTYLEYSLNLQEPQVTTLASLFFLAGKDNNVQHTRLRLRELLIPLFMFLHPTLEGLFADGLTP